MKVGTPLPWSPSRLLLGLALLAAPVAAAQTDSGLGGQAAPFLTQAPDARTAAMGQAGVALPAGASALSLDPAGLAGLTGQDLAVSHSLLPLGASLESAEYGVALGGGAALGFSGEFMDMGSVDRSSFDAGGNLVADGSFTPYGYSVGVAYAGQVANLALGALVKLVGQDIDGHGATTGAADAGLRYALARSGFSLGAAVQDLGGTLYGSALPTLCRAGVSYSDLGVAGGFSLSVDAALPTASASQASFLAGAEVALARYMTLRAGYQLADRSGLDGLSGPSAGVGFGDGHWRADYAWVPHGDLGTDNQFSLSLQF
jgi:hypothetical protein